MITGKQRAFLRGLGGKVDTTVYIGKSEMTDATLAEMDRYLKAHEVVKVKIQEGADLDVRETANLAAERLGAEFVQAIGRKFVLYRANPEKPLIELPKIK